MLLSVPALNALVSSRHVRDDKPVDIQRHLRASANLRERLNGGRTLLEAVWSLHSEQTVRWPCRVDRAARDLVDDGEDRFRREDSAGLRDKLCCSLRDRQLCTETSSVPKFSATLESETPGQSS